ncbi:MAG TPA: ATP-binding protein [Spirochaetales bacterium]|nr:ATP-binding protein [Spirochaetales bacterium]
MARRSLQAEIRFLAVAIPTIIVVAVAVSFTAVVSRSLSASIAADAELTAAEVLELMAAPLYRVDNQQVSRIAWALLSSERIQSIRVTSPLAGTVFESPATSGTSFRSVELDVVYQGHVVGSVSMEFGDQRLRQTRSLLYGLGAALIGAAALANIVALLVIFRFQVSRTFTGLLSGIDAISAGDYETRVPLTRFSDVNSVLNLLNDMAARVLEKNRALKAANEELETRVGERTAELARSLAELKSAQEQLVASEKLSALGNLAAGIAHELNTPMGAIISSSDALLEYFGHQSDVTLRSYASLSGSDRALFERLLGLGFKHAGVFKVGGSDRKRKKELAGKLELRGTACPAELAEHLVELGLDTRLDELDGFLGRDCRLDLLKAASSPIQARRMAALTAMAAKKAADVVGALKLYLSSERDPEPQYVPVRDSIEAALTILHKRLEPGIALTLDLNDQVAFCHPDQLSRLWMNLVLNAVQAMNGSGRLSIGMATRDGMLEVSVADSGPGIPDGVMENLFKPFFTTKKGGEGMGLGLALCQKIVDKHGGAIHVASQPGHTVFTVSLPLNRPEPD